MQNSNITKAPPDRTVEHDNGITPKVSPRQAAILMRRLRELASRAMPPGAKLKLRDQADTVAAALRAEHPLVGRRYYERHVASDERPFITSAEVQDRNYASRSAKRAQRQVASARKRRRGW